MDAIILLTDILEKMILLGLFSLSVWSISIIFERRKYFRSQISQQSLENLKELKKTLNTGDISAAEALLKKSSGAFQEGLSELFSGGFVSAEGADRRLSAFVKESRLKMESGLPVLATLGSNAPFIGLFGTVLGIIRAFAYLGNQSGSAAVMTGVSQALYATAIGLFVAIPAVVSYNIFNQKIRGFQTEIESVRDLWISIELKKQKNSKLGG